jgi:hypothetical protein
MIRALTLAQRRISPGAISAWSSSCCTTAEYTSLTLGRSPSWRNPTSSLSTSAVEPRKDALTSSDGVVGYPIDFDIASSIEGKESQVRVIFDVFLWIISV